METFLLLFNTTGSTSSKFSTINDDFNQINSPIIMSNFHLNNDTQIITTYINCDIPNVPNRRWFVLF